MHDFENMYLAQKALVLYRHTSNEHDMYIEAFDMDDRGRPVSAHPLSMEETACLAESLAASAELNTRFLQSNGLLPYKVLYMDSGRRGYVLWYTPEQKTVLYFTKSLGIPCGEAWIPAMLWKADKDHLNVFAVKANRRPDEMTTLYHAPFFNIYEEGKVCMGNVDIEMPENCCLQDFIKAWEAYFFDSYFSHLVQGHACVKMNIVQLWQEQVSSGKHFPKEILVKTGKKLKDIIV